MPIHTISTDEQSCLRGCEVRSSTRDKDATEDGAGSIITEPSET